MFNQGQKSCNILKDAVFYLQAVRPVLPNNQGSLGFRNRLSLHSSKVPLGAIFEVQSGAVDVTALQQSLPLGWPLVLYEALAAVVLAILILNYQQRPRGWSNLDLVQARSHNTPLPSELLADLRYCFQVGESPVAGQGLFATVDITKGQVLGAYPGVPRSAESMLQKASAFPNCKRYVFQTDLQVWLDPTDSAGLLVNKPNGSVLHWKWDASMASVNEPPTGHAVNVEIVDGVNDLDLIFKATRDIPAGSEIFLDYGKTYDRSSYK